VCVCVCVWYRDPCVGISSRVTLERFVRLDRHRKPHLSLVFISSGFRLSTSDARTHMFTRSLSCKRLQIEQ